MLAHAPGQGVMVAIECTTGPLQAGGGKLGKFVARVAALRAALTEPHGTSVLAVMATALSRDHVAPADRAAAEANGVIVLDREDLAALADLALEPGAAGAVLEFLRDRAPDVGRVARMLRR